MHGTIRFGSSTKSIKFGRKPFGFASTGKIGSNLSVVPPKTKESKLARGRIGNCNASPVGTAVSDQLVGDSKENWNQCMDVLLEIGLESNDAEKYLARAYGWGSQAYWRKEKVQVVPHPKELRACIEYLNSLGLEGKDLVGIIAKFPEVLGCDVEARLRKNVDVLESQWKLKGSVLTNTLKRKPEILGFTIDCYGDCAGECNRCWVRF